MIKNYFNKTEWFHVITKTLICFGYKSDLKLSEKHWSVLFEQNLHPLKAIQEMEGIYPLVCYHEVRKTFFIL